MCFGIPLKRDSLLIGKLLILIVIYCLIFGNAAFAANDQTGTNPGNFLKLGGGVRPISMGNAFVAVADDLSAIYWNPAGLTQIKSTAFSSTYASWLADMSYSNISFVSSIPRVNMSTGLSIDYISAGQIEETTSSQPYGTGKTFTPSFLALTMPLAFQPLEPLSIGFNVKTLFDRIGTSDAIGYGIDAGVLWKITDNISAGLCARNLVGSLAVLPTASNQTNQATQAKQDLASNYALGLSYRLPSLNLGLDYNLPSDNQGAISLGAEYNIKDTFFGRVGFSTRSEENAGGNWGAGLGLKFGILKLDYAYAPYGDLGITHRVSFGLFFPEPKPPATAETKTSAEASAVPPVKVKAIAVPSTEASAIPAGLIPGVSSGLIQETKPATLEAPASAKKIIKPVKKKAPVKKKTAKKYRRR